MTRHEDLPWATGLLVALLAVPTPGPLAAQDEPTDERAQYRVSTLVELESGTGGLTVSPSGTIYHSDFGSQLGGRGTGGHRVFEITPEGGVSVLSTALRGASGSEWGHDGKLYQSSIGGNTLSSIEVSGANRGTTVEFVAGLRSPVGVAQAPTSGDRPGDFFVANCGAASIQRVAADGTSAVWIQSPLLRCPNGIVVRMESDEVVAYVANFMNGDVIRISGGEAEVFATIPGGNNGHLFAHDGSLWVAARGTHQIVRVPLEGPSRGRLFLVAGTGAKGGVDGSGAEATFVYPNDLGFSPDGAILYVNEVADASSTGALLSPTRIRKIERVDR